MKIKVTKDLCEIKENEIWNVGDYNVHTVQVELSPEFNGLVNKVRYFVEDNSYDMLITDNVAQVPYEATVMEGTIKIGVYGYDADTDILVQSTSPVNKYITSGTYTGDADNTQPLTPTDKEQMESAIQKNTNDITDLKANKQDTLISGVNIKTINNESILSGGNLTLVTEETDPIFTNSPAYSITDNDITYWNNKANMSDIPDVSNFITKDVDDLTYYTKSTDMQTAINNAVGNERTARENADNSLQNQIDAITVSSDVVDVVSTYQDLVDYDTQHIKANDIIKVMQDSTHDNAISYYRWLIVNHVGSWVYVGSEGPYYTKSETDTLLNAKQNTITTTNKLQSDLVDDTNQTNLFVTSTEKTTWNNKLDQSDLTDYVKNTDYASSSTGGVIKTAENNGFAVSSAGNLYAVTRTFSTYSSDGDALAISKGTLENVITGKNLETANNKVTSISSSSTDVQYPTAKCVYDNDVIIQDDVNTKYDYLFSLTNLFGKITGTGTSVTLNDTSDTIMKLNLDTTTSSQEDTPSPSDPQEIHTITGNNEIKINNKNLYHMQSATPNSSTSYTINNNNSIRVYNTSASWRSAYTELTVPAGDYAFSFQSIVTSGAKQVIIQKVIDGTATDFKAMTITNETTFTLDSETLLRFVFFSTTGTNTAGDVTYSNIQLENNTSVTSFEPYKQQTYPINLGDIELCKIGDYKDVLFKNTLNSEYYNSSLELNKWYKLNNIGKRIFNGDEYWSTDISGDFNRFSTGVPDIMVTSGRNANSISNYFRSSIDNAYGIIWNTGQAIYLYPESGITTVSQFKSWLSSHNTTAYYPLETPTYTLLNDTLQTQLDNLQYAMAYDDKTYITQTNADIPFTIDAETLVEIDKMGYVKNTDYATSSKGGVIKTGSLININSNGIPYGTVQTFSQYSVGADANFISKGTLENVITGKGLIDSSYHDSTKQDIEDNTLTTVHKTIPTAINEVDSIAKGANQALSYVNYSTMISTFNSLANNVYNTGQNVMIVTLQVPDLWISGIESTSSTYTYTTDEAITTALSTNGYIQVGYYKLSALETQKVDLTNYVTNTDYATAEKGGTIRTSNASGLGISNGNLYAVTKAYNTYNSASGNMFIGKGTLENVVAGKELDLKQLSTFDSTKTQVLKNINGTLTWVDES